MTWWYNSSSGALTSAGTLQTLSQQFGALFGATGDWHQLPIPSTDTGAQAAAEAQKLYPTGTAPTTSVATQVANASGAGGAVSAFTSTENALSGFYDVLTNGKMWRSLAWLLLGVMLMLVGIVLLLRKPIEGIAGDMLRSGVLA